MMPYPSTGQNRQCRRWSSFGAPSAEAGASGGCRRSSTGGSWNTSDGTTWNSSGSTTWNSSTSTNGGSNSFLSMSSSIVQGAMELYQSGSFKNNNASAANNPVPSSSSGDGRAAAVAKRPVGARLGRIWGAGPQGQGNKVKTKVPGRRRSDVSDTSEPTDRIAATGGWGASTDNGVNNNIDGYNRNIAPRKASREELKEWMNDSNDFSLVACEREDEDDVRSIEHDDESSTVGEDNDSLTPGDGAGEASGSHASETRSCDKNPGREETCGGHIASAAVPPSIISKAPKEDTASKVVVGSDDAHHRLSSLSRQESDGSLKMEDVFAWVDGLQPPPLPAAAGHDSLPSSDKKSSSDRTGNGSSETFLRLSQHSDQHLGWLPWPKERGDGGSSFSSGDNHNSHTFPNSGGETLMSRDARGDVRMVSFQPWPGNNRRSQSARL